MSWGKVLLPPLDEDLKLKMKKKMMKVNNTKNFQSLFKTNERRENNFKPLAEIEPHIFGLLVRRVNHYTTRTNYTKNAAS